MLHKLNQINIRDSGSTPTSKTKVLKPGQTVFATIWRIIPTDFLLSEEDVFFDYEVIGKTIDDATKKLLKALIEAKILSNDKKQKKYQTYYSTIISNGYSIVLPGTWVSYHDISEKRDKMIPLSSYLAEHFIKKTSRTTPSAEERYKTLLKNKKDSIEDMLSSKEYIEDILLEVDNIFVELRNARNKDKSLHYTTERGMLYPKIHFKFFSVKDQDIMFSSIEHPFIKINEI